MSLHSEAREPECLGCANAPAIKLRIQTKPKDVGGFEVRRSLPSRLCRSIGPFIFFDEMGPADLPEGVGMDVRPHPHINLATITYLFEGAIDHRDSLGTFQTIEPGAINLMVAGKGIVHSERTPEDMRRHSERLHGVQLWIALPEASEEIEPAFFHYPPRSIPEQLEAGVKQRVLMGRHGDLHSPVQSFSESLYMHVDLEPGSVWRVPVGLSERAAYLVAGRVSCDGQTFDEPEMLIFESGVETSVAAEHQSRLIFVAGEPLGKRHMYWNFVSSRPERIAQAKVDWEKRRFPVVPGDEHEFIPLPNS